MLISKKLKTVALLQRALVRGHSMKTKVSTENLLQRNDKYKQGLRSIFATRNSSRSL
jgi:hypothetical protein